MANNNNNNTSPGIDILVKQWRSHPHLLCFVPQDRTLPCFTKDKRFAPGFSGSDDFCDQSEMITLTTNDGHTVCANWGPLGLQ